MLRELAGVRQDEPGLSRHWFQDDYFDLFLWLTPAGRVSAFQLGYDRTRRERVLSWSSVRGFSHARVDSGERCPMNNMTPLLLPGGLCPVRVLLREFDRRSVRLDRAVRAFLHGKLRHGRRLRRLRGSRQPSKGPRHAH
jgi:hypothetical protein